MAEEFCIFPALNDGVSDPPDGQGAIHFDTATIEAVSACCQQSNSQIEYVLSTIWAVILRRYTGSKQVVMGMGVGAQRYSLRPRLEPTEPVRKFLLRDAWEAVSCFRLAGTSYNTSIAVDHDTTKTAGHHSSDSSCGSELGLVYDTSAHQPTLILRYRCGFLSRSYATLLTAAVAQVARSILNDSSRAFEEIAREEISTHRQLIQKWNSTPVMQPPSCAIHSIVHQHALRRPHQPAIHAWDETFSFTELDRLSSQLAAHLQGYQVGPGCMVAVYFEKSAWAVVAMLAINKTGAAFVPLDSAYPRSRSEEILRIAGVSTLITSSQYEDLMSDLAVRRVTVARDKIETLPDVSALQPIVLQPTTPAYCLFTSGSTGSPRGCLVSHAALASVTNHAQPLHIDASSRVLQFASLTFGISLIEIWCSLSAGGTICMPSADDRQNRLAAVMKEMEINWALMTPTSMADLRPDDVPSLRVVGVAGEPLPKAQIDTWAGAVRLFQAYGLTEWAGICAVSAQVQTPESNTVIGDSAGGHFWLVDPDNHHILAPIGAEAELLIEGPSLALGYLGEPERTAEAFLSSPPAWMGTMPQSEKLYKTGDLVRYRSDGSLEFISRKGTQVKLRGQRLELREVEYHILCITHKFKKVVAEIVQPGGADANPLLAVFLYPGGFNDDPTSVPETTDPKSGWFFETDDEFRANIAQISQALSQLLPSYMIPQLFLPLRHLPVTASGKVNRRQLRDIVHLCDREWLTALTEEKEPIMAPRTNSEAQIHRWVVQILQLTPTRVGMADDFFKLGGDSASAIKLVGLARRQKIAIKVADIFQRRTLGRLSELIEESSEIPSPSSVPSALKRFQLLQDQIASDAQIQSLIHAAAEQCGVPDGEVEDIYPCTPMQEGLMALSMTHAGSGFAHFQYHFQPDIAIDRLHTAWRAVVDTNAILRTRIVQFGDRRMYQVVVRPQASPCDAVVDGLALPPLIQYGANLLTARMEKQPNGSSTFTIIIHHALCDRWSMTNIIRGVEQAYFRLIVPRSPCYAHFIAEVSDQRRRDQVRNYWQSQMAGLSTVHFPPVPVGYRPNPRTQLKRLITLPAHAPQGATVATLLRLAWAVILAAHTSCDDVVFGTTISGRGAAVPGIDMMTGPTLANVPLRIRLQPDDRIDQTLNRLEEHSIGMTPFEQVGTHDISGYSEETATACRFNSHLVIQPFWELPAHKLCSGYQADAMTAGGFAASALNLVCWLGKDQSQVQAEVTFDQKVVSADLAQRLLTQLGNVLHQIVQRPLDTIEALSVITDEERRLLRQWNEQSQPPLPAPSVAALLHGHVANRPNDLAICSWDGDLTYSQLDLESSRLAMRLTEHGVGVHDFVPILLGRSKWTPVAIWAAIKTGAAFVLLDPAHPAERLQFICETVNSRVVLSSVSLADKSIALGQRILRVDDDATASDQYYGSFCKPPATEIGDDSILYVVFTSGSTGKPKGVVIEHRSFCASAMAHNPMHQINSTSRVLQNASHAFDVSIMEILSTLLAGACVCIPSQEDLRDAFVETANRLRVTHVFLTPSVVRAHDISRLTTIHTLILGGESLRPAETAKLNRCKFRIIHEYGPAECSISATAQEARFDGEPLDSKTIGFPMGCQCWVVDRHHHQRLVPIGTVGELLIGGPIVGRGYLNDPQRTENSFITMDPSWAQVEDIRSSDRARMYKTGDLVRFRDDGSLEYVGRCDLQVKIRGQRIELAEVETYVRQGDWISGQEVIVELAGLGPNKIPSLVAFIGPPQQGTGLSLPDNEHLILPPSEGFQSQAYAVELRLQGVLPPVMIPSLFVAVHHIPLGRTGKIDRQALRAAAEALPAETLKRQRGMKGQDQRRAPTTEKEKTLSNIWSSVLGVECESLGLDDHFFRLGGDSLSAIDVAARCQALGWELSVSQIFSKPMLEQQAQLLNQRVRAAELSPPVPFSLLPQEAKDAVVRTAIEQCHIVADHIEDIYPCTPLQEGLLALTARDSTAYIGQWFYQLPSTIDLAQLRVAWTRLVQIHPILRTRMAQADDNRLYQIVCRDGALLQEWGTDEIGDHELQKIRSRMTLGQPQADVIFCRAQDGRPPRLLLTMHHAIYDQNSMINILRDFRAAYYGRTDLCPQPFTPFIRYLQNISEEDSKRYWQDALAGFDVQPFPELPSSGYRPAPTTVIERHWDLLDATAAPMAGLDRSAATFTTKAYSAWAIVQSTYQRSRDVMFGVTVSGRAAPLPGIQTMTGPTLATIPFRLQMTPEQSLASLLQMTQDSRIAAIPYEQVGLQNIARCGSSASQAVAFQTLLIVQQEAEDTDPRDSSRFMELAESLTGWTAFTTYALLISCTLSTTKPGRINVQASFDPRVISAAHIDRVLTYLGDIFQILDQKPQLLLRDIPSASRQDQDQIFRWNSRDVQPTARHCIHDLIQERCDRNPTAPAVCAWDGNFTYGELDSYSSSLASHLVAKGVRPETHVPLYFEKSRWTTVAIVAVLKAGGAFVLLDPSHPSARLQAICEQLCAPVIITSERYTGASAALCAHSVVVGDQSHEWVSSVDPMPVYPSNPSRALYIVFTSGSTGQPKGVVIEHGCYTAAAQAHIPKLRLTHHSRVLQFAAYAFDVSIMDHLSTLLVGGCICVPSEAQRRDGLIAVMASMKPTHAMLTPSFARSMPDPEHLPSLQVVSLIGEKVQAIDIQKWAPTVRFLNAYGPAECSVVSTIQDCFGDSTDPSNIGFGVGATCWVVDPHDPSRLTPIGEPGELLVHGNLVGRGYLGLPEKTAEVFIAPPAWLQTSRPGEPTSQRLYRTGDLVKYTEDGSLVYLGRKDTQVKIRGQRLELGEVEARVHECFTDATDVVVEVVQWNEQNMLAAFILRNASGLSPVNGNSGPSTEPISLFQLGNDESRIEAAAAQSQLHHMLPDYMVPSIFVPLTSMPRGPSGKADRACLRKTAAGLSVSQFRTYRPGNSENEAREPSTDSERTLQAVWSEVLRLPLSAIGATDHFFQLGGDSIIAMKAAPLAREHGLNVTVADIFDYPRLGDLARIGEEQQAALAKTQPPEGEKSPFSLSPMSHPDRFFDQLRAIGIAPADSKMSDLIPVTEPQAFFIVRRTTHHYTFSITGSIDVERLRLACSAVFEKHSVLRTLIARYDGQLVQVILRQMHLPFQHISNLTDLATYQKSLWEVDDQGHDILAGVPTRFILLSTQDSQRHALIMRLTHAQWDAVSIPVLFNDISVAYNGQSVPTTTDFPAFVYHRAREPRDAAVRFWHQLLQGSTLAPVPTSASDHVDPADCARTLWENKDIVPPPATPAGITMATLVKAAWAHVLWQLSGQEDITFTQTVNGRGLPLKDADRILGPCLNFIPVRLQMQCSAWTVQDLLQRVQHQHTQSLRHEFVDWSELVEQSTDWPKETEVQSIVQHQNFDFDYKMPLDGLDTSFALEHNFIPRSELFVFTYPMPERLLVQVCVSTAIMSQDRAVSILHRLCNTIQAFAQYPDRRLCDLPIRVASP